MLLQVADVSKMRLKVVDVSEMLREVARLSMRRARSAVDVTETLLRLSEMLYDVHNVS